MKKTNNKKHQQPVTPPSAPAPIRPSVSLPAAAADVLASLFADALTAGPIPGQPAPRDPLTRARCADGVSALFPARAAMVKAGLKDPCAILAREAAERLAAKVPGAGTPEPASLASGAPAEGGGLRTPTPLPSPTSRANVTGGPAPNAGNGTIGFLYVRRNETRGGDVVLGGRR
jgi:hypothetical protein